MELIEMEIELITEDEIDIRNDCTIFASEKRVKYPEIKELEKQVKELRKELKNRNVSLGKTDTLKILKERKVEYEEMVKEYNHTFDLYLCSWQNKMHIGMYIGYGSDEYYNEVLTPLNFKLQKMNRRDNILSIIQAIEYKVKEVQTDLKIGKEYTKIWI
jgi:hypothetical protein